MERNNRNNFEKAPNYYAVIPAKVRYDKSLKANEKLLYGEITALANKNGYCWATNSYFASLFGVTNITVSNWIANLVNKGYLHREVVRNENNQVEERKLFIVEKINVNIPKKEEKKEKKEYPYKEIIDYLNKKLDKRYRSSTPKTQELIRARIDEGFNVEDFEEVIDKKALDWKGNPEMDKYLRPQTLFGTKFESYLNEDINIYKGNKNENERRFSGNKAQRNVYRDERIGEEEKKDLIKKKLRLSR